MASSNLSGTDVFMYNYCNSTFWDPTLLQADYPSFTSCFNNIALVWGPCGLLLLISPYYLLTNYNGRKPKIKWSLLHSAKLISLLAMLAAVLVQLFYRVYELSVNDVVYTTADFVSPSVIAGTLLLALAIQERARLVGDASNAGLFMFWFILLLCGIPTFSDLARSAVDDEIEDLVEFITFYVYWGFLFVMFVLNMFAEYQVKPKNANPEEYSSFFNQIFYWWFNPMLYLGYKNPLTVEDMWELNDKDKSVNCAKMLDEHWNEQLKKNNPSLYQPVFKNGYQSNGHTNKAFSDKQTKKSKDDLDIDDVGYQIYDRHSKYQPSLVKSLILQFWKPFFLAMVLKLGNDLIQFVSPELLSLLIDFVGDETKPMWQGYFYAAAMYVIAVVKSIMLQYYFYICYIIGMNMRTTLNAIIYKKALRLSNAARGKSTVGEIVNLMMVDSQRLMDLMAYINILWSGPLQIILSLVFLWQVLGIAVLAGFAVMILVIPINLVVVKKLRELSAENMKLKDQRVKLTTEVLNGAKVIKLYAWEPSFINQITDIRSKELTLARKLAVIKAAVYFLFNCTPFIVSIVSFAVYLALDEQNVLDSTTAFVSLSLFNILRFPLIVLPNVITSTVAASVSVKRLTKYLLSTELDPAAVNNEHAEESQIEVKDGTFSWDGGENVLDDINMQVKPKELVAVVGHVGCGKSSLVAALLGEMEKIKGYVGLRGSVAYVPQQAWIQNATVKDNILFGKSISDQWEETSFSSKEIPKLSEEFYKEAIRATALESDLKILTAGDMTEIGEKGVNLSGGQKQRVSLARAVYSDADVYILDDPLSAVDSHVGAHIFDNVISHEGLLKNKTRILVTHSVAYLERCDKIIVMDHGKITEVGSYSDLVRNGDAFSKFLDEFANKQESDDENEDETMKPKLSVTDEEFTSLSDSMNDFVDAEEQDEEPIEAMLKKEHRESVRSRGSRKSSRKMSKKSKADEKKDENTKGEDGKLISKEGAKEGNVSGRVFAIYMKAIGYFMVFIILVAEILYQGATIGTSIFLSDWSDDADKLNVTESRNQSPYRLGVYGALGFAQAVLICAETYTMAIGSIAAARKIHYNMLNRILRAPMSFFDTTPVGRIINRFAKDIYTIDDTLPWSIRMMNNCFLSVIGTIAVIMIATPIFGAVIVPIFVLYWLSQRFYVRTSRQLKRIESVTRSPIYSQFQETLSGVSTIRAFKLEDSFIDQADKKVDINQGCYYPNIVSNRWLAIQLDVVGNAIVFFAALFAVLGRETGVDASEAALSVSYALQITSTLNWMVRQISEVETQIVSVERTQEYSELTTEADWEAPKEIKPGSSWPAKGNVAFDSYSTRYREGLDLVVKNISCSIYPGEKAGIVGRTGAGKSSLTLALFRLIEPANGRIIIDGVDISKIGLHDLRKKVTIIPQDPVLFSGTLRLNLDPFESYSDDQLWDSLRQSHLYEYVSGLPDKLEHLCAEGGENLSVGQRQLVCLARALLRKSKILVLDEATAAVDLQTDELIQSTIREQFKDSTILTIAHRLNTIMDYDKILVLHEGKLMEMDSPTELLKNKKSAFYSMAKDAKLV